MEQPVILLLNKEQAEVVARGLGSYKNDLLRKEKKIDRSAFSRLISDEISSIGTVIEMIEHQKTIRISKQTIINLHGEISLVQSTLLQLRDQPESTVLGFMGEDRWIEIRYIPTKGYELRVDQKMVFETPDVENMSEAFVSWCSKKPIDWHQ